jgi:hypothetical protein
MSKNIIDIIERVKIINKIHTDHEVAKILGISKANLSNYRSKGSIPYDALSNYCERENLSVDYILFGTGDPAATSPAFSSARLAEPEALYGVGGGDPKTGS